MHISRPLIQDLSSAASSVYGAYSGGGGSSSCFKLDICPDLLMAGLATAFAAFFYILHTTITMKGRKKRRSLSKTNDFFDLGKITQDMLHLGTPHYYYFLYT